MKLKLLFCKCVQKIVDSCKEGLDITSIEHLIDTQALPAFLLERMDTALKTISHKILTHYAIRISDQDEVVNNMEAKLEMGGLRTFLTAIEQSGLECTEIISLVESKDIITMEDEFSSAIIPESPPQSAHDVSKSMLLDTLVDLQNTNAESVFEHLQLQHGDVNKTEVKLLLPTRKIHTNLSFETM